MNKPVKLTADADNIRFLRDAKHLEWTVGNITLDASDLDEGQIVEQGTCVYKDDDSGLYKLVQGSTPATMTAPVITGEAVEVVSKEVNVSTSAIRKASVYEDLLVGVTDNFKQATQGRIVFDV